MDPIGLEAALAREPDMVTPDGESEFWVLEQLDGTSLWLGRFVGESPWTIHRGADNVIHVLAGCSEVRVLTSAGEERLEVAAGCIWKVPGDTWHRHRALEQVTLWGTMFGEHAQSEAEDPRGS